MAGEPVRGVLITGYRHHLDVPSMVSEGAFKSEGRKDYRSGWWSGFCYTSDIFFPRTLPFRGVYNDYGGIENVDGELHKRIIQEQFSVDLVEQEEGELSLPPAVRKDMTFDELLNCIQHDAVVVVGGIGYDPQRVPVGLWMVREDIYQAILASKLTGRWGGRSYTRAYFKEKAHAFLENLGASYGKRLLDDELREVIKRAGDKAEDIEKSLVGYRALRKLVGDSDGLFPSPPFENSIAFYHNWLADRVENTEIDPASDEVYQLIAEAGDFAFFRAVMDSMRIAFMPQPGSGSQDDRVSGHAAVARAVLQVVKRVMKEEREYRREHVRPKKPKRKKK
jgi:hypothetical protein